MQDCPKCKTRALSPMLLAAGLSAKGCNSCKGILIDLLAYRAWADLSGIDAIKSNISHTEVQVNDTSEVITCPCCTSIMTKYRISSKIENRLDYCANCDQAWLDGGEWNQLADLGLRTNLGTVFTEPWQKRVHEETSDTARDSLLRERFGVDYKRIAEIKEWLLDHPKYEDIIAWFKDRDR